MTRSRRNKRRAQCKDSNGELKKFFSRSQYLGYYTIAKILHPTASFASRDDVATQLRANCERPDASSDVRILRSPTFARNRIFIRVSPEGDPNENILIATASYYSPCRSFWLFCYFVFFFFLQRMCNSAFANKGRNFKFDTLKMELNVEETVHRARNARYRYLLIEEFYK